MSAAEPLVCPSCGRAHEGDVRFCENCGVPLVYAGADAEPEAIDRPVSEQREWARKVKRQYAEGRLVHAVGARNQTEAEFIQGMLLEEGVPSILRRTRGFDVPEMLAAGPRDVLVPESGLATAREVLLQADLLAEDRPIARPGRVLAALVGAVVVVAAIAWIGTEVGL